jgi:methionyl aminopeptidase
LKINLKSNYQIRQIKKSCKITSDTLAYLAEIVKPGISTEEINQKADEFIRKQGAVPAPLNYRGYPKSVCTSVNEVICHGIPSETEVLQDGDIIGVDVATIINGFFGDACFTFPVGTITEDKWNLLKIARKSLDIGLGQVVPKANLGNIGYEINKFVTEAGYSVVYEFVGHGTGLAFHEDPKVLHNAKKGSGPIMLPRMIFTCEPMINIGKPEVIIDEVDEWTARTRDGSLSAQYEHTILVTENGHEVLTTLPDYLLDTSDCLIKE